MGAYTFLLRLLPGWFREEFAREMSADFRDTRADARRRGGSASVALWLRTVRDVAALATRLHLESLQQDTSYALRTLKRTPAFTLAAVATLAIGMGPAVVVAHLVQQVLIAPLPFADSERLVAVWSAQPERNRREFPFAAPDYVELRDGQRAFESFAAHTGTSVTFIASGEPRQLNGVLTTSDLFSVLKIMPVLGRPLGAADSAPGAPPVIVLGDELWRSTFAARADVIGQRVTVDGASTEIIGVLGAAAKPRGRAARRVVGVIH